MRKTNSDHGRGNGRTGRRGHRICRLIRRAASAPRPRLLDRQGSPRRTAASAPAATARRSRSRSGQLHRRRRLRHARRSRELDGPLTFHVKTTVDSTTRRPRLRRGLVQGRRTIDTEAPWPLRGHAQRDGQFAGFLDGVRPQGQQGRRPRHPERDVRGRHGLRESGLSARTSSDVGAGRHRRPGLQEGAEARSRTRRPRTTSGSTSTARSRRSAGPPAAWSRSSARARRRRRARVDGSSPSTTGFAVNDKVKMKCEHDPAHDLVRSAS